MTALRGVTTQWTGGDTTAEVVMPTCQTGDHLVIFVGGGNHATNVPTGWEFFPNLTGQEAQGIVYHRTATADETGDIVTVDFDGTDPRYIAAIAVKDWDGWNDVNGYDRAGTAGGTLAASTEEWTADQYRGDLLLTFAFCRNAATPPTMDRGTLWEARTEDGSSAALYIESLPEFNEDEPFALDLPERSGHVYFSLPVYGLTTSEWIQGPDFEVEQELWQTVLQDTKLDQDEARHPDHFPTITQATFLFSQEVQVFGFGSGTKPAVWNHVRFVDLDTGEFVRGWVTSRTVSLYAAHLPAADLDEPFNDTFPADAIGAAEWEAGSPTAGSQAVAANSKVAITDVAGDTTDVASGNDLISNAFSTVLFSAGGEVTWDTSDEITSWTRLVGPDAEILHIRNGQVTPGITSTTIDVTDALDPSGQARLVALSIVLGPGGSGDPQMNLRSYEFEGEAEFGARYDFQNVEGAALTWTIRPGLRRHILRRGPVVDIRPVVISVAVTRQFPRDDAYGLGSAPRLFPPPRAGRVVGGHM